MHILKAALGIVLLSFFALLPLRLSQAFGRLLGRIIYRTKSTRIYDVSSKNIDVCFPQWSEQQRQSLLKASLQHTCMSYAEMGFSYIRPPALALSKIVSVSGEDVLEAAIAKGNGVIMIAPHIGNWEILNLYVSSRYPLTVLYKPPKSAFFNWLINKMRQRTGGNTAPANASGVKKIFKSLRSDGIVGILPDQEPAMGSGVFCPFYHRPAYTMTLLSQLARKSKASIVTCIALRLDKGRGYALHFAEAEPGIDDPDALQGATALNLCIEKIASANPEQYQWEYKRYRKEAPGLQKIY
ncbi:MAG: lysophospholipid acyltransferase family protein [Pseudomonadales bacterium]